MEVGDAGPDGEDGGDDGRNDGGDVEELEHDPAEGDHLGDSADFPGPVRIDGDAAVDEVENPDSDDDFQVPHDHENEKPHGEVPILPPVDEGHGDESGEEEGFITEGIENGSEEAFLIELSRDPSIEPIKGGGEDVGADGEPA